MRTRDFGLFLGVELFAIAWAGLWFSTLDNKILAGALAGGYFLFSGLYMLWRLRGWSPRWQSPTWYVLLVHVFAISLPMLISRFMQINLSFEDVRILGLTGPQFHQVSNYVFMALIFSTIVDGVRVKRATGAAPLKS